MTRKVITVLLIIFFLSICFPSSLYSDAISAAFDSMEVHSTDPEGSLSGYVTDPSMNPISGAQIRVHFHGNYSENYSDETGYYHVEHIPICYCLKNTTCSKEGYETEWVLLSIYENTTYDFMLTPLNSSLIFLNGTMGENGWYISPVFIILMVSYFCKYKIDNSSWITYTGPFSVTDDGYHQILCYWVDESGEQSDIYSADFKIDQTSPTIQLTSQRINHSKVKIIATVDDATSGVYRVEFYDDMGTHITLYEPPYEIMYVGFDIHVIHATVSDYAGNTAKSTIITPFSHTTSFQWHHQKFLYHMIFVLLHNIQALLQKIQ